MSSLYVDIDLTALAFLEQHFPGAVNAIASGLTQDYYDRVMKQFDVKPAYWRPLDPRTVEWKRALRAAGQPVAFTSPEQVLVNYGLMRDSITIVPDMSATSPGTTLPMSFMVGIFAGAVGGRERLKWAWQHEFGTNYLIHVRRWSRRRAMGVFRSIRTKIALTWRTPLAALKIGKADIEGKMNIEKFINAVRKLSMKLRRKILVKGGIPIKRVSIPRRSIFRRALRDFEIPFLTGVVQALRAFIVATQAMVGGGTRVTI